MKDLQNVLLANAVVLMVPGLNFSVVVRNAITHGIHSANWTAIGITTAIMVHVFLGLFSLSALLIAYPALFNIIKYLGCLYIIYLGTYYLYLSRKTQNNPVSSDIEINKKNSFKTGFMIDILNPFVSIFYVSIFSPIITQNKSFSELSIYFISIAILTLSWFVLVGNVFSKTLVRNFLNKYHVWIQRVSGFAMYFFSYKLFISSL